MDWFGKTTLLVYGEKIVAFYKVYCDTEDCNKLYAYEVVEYFKSQRGDKHEQ